MLGLTAVPVKTWHNATAGPTFHGFDRNLISVNNFSDRTSDQSQVAVSPDRIVLRTVGAPPPSVHLLTTASSGFRVAMNVSIQENPDGTTPLRLGLWSPWSGSGYFLVFGPAPDNAISSEAVVNGSASQTLVGGTIDRTILGHYAPGQIYQLGVTLNKSVGLLSYDLSGPTLSPIRAMATPSNPPGLLTEQTLTLSASAMSANGGSIATLEGYTLGLPPESAGAIKVDDPVAKGLVGLLAAVGLLLIVVGLLANAGSLRRRLAVPRVFSLGRKAQVVVAAAVAGVAILNVLLFRLGNSPFDMADQEVWSYIAATYGPAEVYVLAPFVTVAKVWNGIPYGDALFPYQPILVYLFTGFGWISRLFGTSQIEYIAKTVNLGFALLDGLVIFAILRRLNSSWRWSLAAAGLFIFNPAVWFSTSIWGANHVLSLFFILLAILLAEYDHPLGAWLVLGVGSLTRPQMLVLGILVGVYLFRRFTPSRNAYALSVTAIVIFVLISPFTLATSPSLPVDLMASTIQVQALGGNERALTTVSLDAFSFWPLVTLLQAGQSGLARIFYPSDSTLIGSITYHQAGLGVALVVLTAAIVMLAVRPRSNLEAGAYLPVVSFGVSGFLMFVTGLAATHFILALPFILMCRPWLSARGYYAIVAGWTLTTLIAMYGILAVDLPRADYLHAPLFGEHAPLRSVTSFVGQLYEWDRTISVGVAINTLIFLTLMVVAIRSRRTRLEA
jgi:hypothetical protein